MRVIFLRGDKGVTRCSLAAYSRVGWVAWPGCSPGVIRLPEMEMDGVAMAVRALYTDITGMLGTNQFVPHTEGGIFQ